MNASAGAVGAVEGSAPIGAPIVTDGFSPIVAVGTGEPDPCDRRVPCVGAEEPQPMTMRATMASAPIGVERRRGLGVSHTTILPRHRPRHNVPEVRSGWSGALIRGGRGLGPGRRSRRFWNRSTCPAVSMMVCLPVKNGWQLLQTSTRSSWRVEPTVNSSRTSRSGPRPGSTWGGCRASRRFSSVAVRTGHCPPVVVGYGAGLGVGRDPLETRIRFFDFVVRARNGPFR